MNRSINKEKKFVVLLDSLEKYLEEYEKIDLRDYEIDSEEYKKAVRVMHQVCSWEDKLTFGYDGLSERLKEKHKDRFEILKKDIDFITLSRSTRTCLYRYAVGTETDYDWEASKDLLTSRFGDLPDDLKKKHKKEFWNLEGSMRAIINNDMYENFIQRL